jgi:hypothetical protein
VISILAVVYAYAVVYYLRMTRIGLCVGTTTTTTTTTYYYYYYYYLRMTRIGLCVGGRHGVGSLRADRSGVVCDARCRGGAPECIRAYVPRGDSPLPPPV